MRHSWSNTIQNEESPDSVGALFNKIELAVRNYGLVGVVVGAGLAAAGFAGVADAFTGYAWS
jgi:hypothetical protein